MVAVDGGGAVLEDTQAMWDAVQARDTRFDGTFVYAVRSTGVYCRPCCPARRPHRDRVAFFRGPEDAERAGFRACLRCRPKEPSPQAQLVNDVCRFVDAHIEEGITLARLAAATGLSPHHLQRTFRRGTGVTPWQYLQARRLERAKAALRAGAHVADAVYAAGYGSGGGLYARATAHLGMTPGAYRRGGRGQRIRYALGTCDLGTVLVAATDRGVCVVSLGDDAAELEAALNREYPDAEITPDAAGLGDPLEAVLERVAARATPPDLPLDIRGTAFQLRVWQELQGIPAGQTRTYSDLARAVGRPRAVRAVARACAANPVAVVIPCHRVLRRDGSLAGYRWGLERKRALLVREGHL